MQDNDLRAVLFDFDGTLTTPGALDFPAIKKTLGCPVDQPVLEFIQSIADHRKRKTALDQLDRFETAAARQSRPNHGAVEIIRWIKNRRLPVGIVTRNSRASVAAALLHFAPLGADDFEVLITRDEPLAPKPDGEGIRWAARFLGVQPGQVLMVGDYIFDCQAGRAAGARTALLDPHGDPRLMGVACDFRIRRLGDLEKIISSLTK